METFAVMREPVDRLVSWYRYQQRDEAANAPTSTAEMSFETFIDAVLGKDDDRFDWVGRQNRFLMGGGKELKVNHLFRYDAPEALLAFLSSRFNREIAFDRVNVSAAAVEVSDELRRRILMARPREARLWQALQADGYVQNPEA